MIFQNPFCIVLTHRHGACIGMFSSKSSEFFQADFIQTAQSFAEKRDSIVKNDGHFEYIEDSNFIIARSLGKTAENLFDLYKFVSQKFHNSITTIVTGIGPGSFTGLRLGCAFVNGLALSKKYSLFTVKTLLRDELIGMISDTNTVSTIKIELGDYRESDQASGYVTFFDLFFSYYQIKNNQVTESGHLIPHYGREPTPVLKLRKDV